MGGKQSVPQTYEAFSGRMGKFPSLSEDILTKQELEEGVVILDSLNSMRKMNSSTFMDIESDNTRFMMARAEADRIAEAEALRLATEQSIRVNDEGSIVYQSSYISLPSRKDSTISKQPTRSGTVLSKQSTKNSLVALDENLEEEILDNERNLEYIPSKSNIDSEENRREIFEMITNRCGVVFSECKSYPVEEAKKLRNDLRNCDSEYAIDKTAETCGCLGPKHDRLNCPICRGMHLEDAPLLY
ncbi:unnamed protein product [Cryptosporidium hominis]|uniref:Uncharacterized protein n=1 Tax=Cryptosporidium hominis TaxID=237895 RepID=A0A0S4TJ50_CRYHO|nr:hypothetical protein [Cryptosporidium hominis TU502]OLQ18921.1 hypothetical protein ChTU502y2012_415g0225 [Cryptosporidium hominis]PPA63569.1 hypothetical protein ChUKH1_08515 [Cryptosporidium hominis]PPS97412.1 Uncharacterized protein GY17_00000359 [Cryptosporidium hominis]CUV06773.1 unnamed protein product [Cryptosporidium hominis]|eukprot:PPS97412.1 Uncharacterized protein GY17_00000359 [Cryptosporidium hominis]